MRENLLVVTGNPETKELKDMMPEILKQVGPQQYGFLKDIMKNIIPEGKAGEEDEDDVPELVGNFEDASKKWRASAGWAAANLQPLSQRPSHELIGAK